MTTFPKAPKALSGGIVLINAKTGALIRIISLQYNPSSLSRTLQVQGGGESAERSEILRLTGAPVETIKLEAEIDAADQVSLPRRRRLLRNYGILPQLAALETLIYPKASKLAANHEMAEGGALEILPIEGPLTLFVWSTKRVLPVRLTEFSITEEAFDPNLNPIRAKVSLGLRVLNSTDLGMGHRGGTIFHNYHQRLERLARRNRNGEFSDLGFTGGS